MASRTRGGKKRGGSPKVSKTLSSQRFKNTGGILGAVGRIRSGIINDAMMGLGLKEKDYKYEARTARNIRLSRERGGNDYGNDDAPSYSAPRGPTAAELALAKRKAAGQEVRKKFEKEKGERRIALRKRYMKLLKV